MSLLHRPVSQANLLYVSGLPDTKEQFEASELRGGLAAKTRGAYPILDWWKYTTDVWFGPKEQAPSNAYATNPSLASEFPRYLQRRSEFLSLAKGDAQIFLGATSYIFLRVLEIALQNHFVIIVSAHHERDSNGSVGLEFTDGFLPLDRLSEVAAPGSQALVDFTSCELWQERHRLKALVGGTASVLTSPHPLTTTGWLTFHTHLIREAVLRPGPYAALREAAKAYCPHDVGLAIDASGMEEI